MIFFWAFGDALKLLFLVLQAQPLQFIIGIIAQVALELFLLGQYAVYRRNDSEIGDDEVLSPWIV